LAAATGAGAGAGVDFLDACGLEGLVDCLDEVFPKVDFFFEAKAGFVDDPVDSVDPDDAIE
jgi:hypothetical protein